MLVRILLWPLSLLYGILAQGRRFLYSLKVLQCRKQAPLKTIVVGNLRVGGTGKSIVVGYLARALQNLPMPVAILSRGYGRKTRGFLEVLTAMKSSDCGDEPLMLKKQNPQLRVAVCENRYNGLKQLQKLCNPNPLVLLDDAYQHLSLQAHHYILLTEWDRPFFADYVLPMGRLREFRREASHADQILVTKVPYGVGPKQKKQFAKQVQKYSKAPLFWSSLHYGNTVHVPSKKPVEIPVSTPILLVTGIDNPAPILQFLRDQGRNVEPIPFADHKELSTADLQEITQRALERKGVLITTEKDAVRYFMGKKIPAAIQEPWHYLEVKLLVEKEAQFLDPLFTLVS